MDIFDFGMAKLLILDSQIKTLICILSLKNKFILKHLLVVPLILFGLIWMSNFGSYKMRLVELGNINNLQIKELKF
jgi:hypothetical protein